MPRISPLVLTVATLATLASPRPSAQDGVPHFTEESASAGCAYTHTNPVFFPNSDYTGGGAAGDFNHDGWMDWFGVSGGNGPDHLFVNDGDGTFTDKASAWGLSIVHLSKAATAGDYNDDGWLDLYETSSGPVAAPAGGNHKLWRNNGNDSFTNVANAAGVNQTSTSQGGFGAAFGDYDLDGDLDLFVGGHNSSNASNKLFRNNGNGTFTDVTNAIGLFSGVGQTYGFCPRFADLDGDSYPELLLSADFGTSRLWKNDGDGTFTYANSLFKTGKEENGMGGTFGDYNNDGRWDWYVTSIYLPNISWTGNKLYIMTAGGTFSEVSQSAGCFDGGYGWGAVSVDFDHDGWVDIGETNGDNGTPTFLNEQSYLWMNNGNGTFTESAIALGFSYFGAGRGMFNFDADNDGDQDFVVISNFGPDRFYRNTLTGTHISWLRVKLDTTANDQLAPDGYNAKLTATVGANKYYRYVTGGDNFQSASELYAHFGLADATIVDELKVDWANGTSTVLTNVAVDQTLTVTPPEDDEWTRVGLGIGGSNGVPQLRGSGTPTAGNPVTLTLKSARPASPFYLLVSPTTLMAPFKGGTLVPSTGLLLILATDGAGAFSITAPWAAGLPAGTQIWFQAWQQDPTGKLGWNSSNGLRATNP